MQSLSQLTLGFLATRFIPLAILGVGVLGLWFTWSLSRLLDGTSEQRRAAYIQMSFGALIGIGVLGLALMGVFH